MRELRNFMRTEHGRTVWLVINDAWLQVATLSLLAIMWIAGFVSRS